MTLGRVISGGIGPGLSCQQGDLLQSNGHLFPPGGRSGRPWWRGGGGGTRGSGDVLCLPDRDKLDQLVSAGTHDRPATSHQETDCRQDTGFAPPSLPITRPVQEGRGIWGFGEEDGGTFVKSKAVYIAIAAV